jgi:enterochelin esterase family protein
VNRDDEYIGGSQNQYAAFITAELMPYIDARYRTQRRSVSRATIGISNGGNIALWIASNYPEVFGNAGSHSGNIQPATSSAFQSGSLRSLKLYIDAGTYDLAGFLTLSRDFRQAIQSKGYNHRYSEWHEGHSWGNWRAHLDDALEFFFPGPAVSVVEHGTIPTLSQLMQNYPNPFNPVTKIQFSIVNSQLIILKVFDVLGREVRTLVNEELKPGSYEKTFDATGLSSGVYIYRLETKDFVSTKKLLLLR